MLLLPFEIECRNEENDVPGKGKGLVAIENISKGRHANYSEESIITVPRINRTVNGYEHPSADQRPPLRVGPWLYSVWRPASAFPDLASELLH